MTVLEGFIEEMQTVQSFDGLNAKIVGLRDILGIEHVVYHSISSSGDEYAVTTYADDWVDHYISSEYHRQDPVVQTCFRRFHPIDWKSLDWSGRGSQMFMAEAISAGVGNQGLSLPLRGPAGQFALFTLSGRDTDETWDKYTRKNMHDVILLSHLINQKALELEGNGENFQVASLSPRERDSLTLLAMGLNRAQAADTLAISEHTLRVYIESARFKLAANNTTHAVARAMSYGLIVL